MHVTMIGTGYVGLVSGACFSEFGHDVTCVDKDSAKIEALRAGEIPIFEPGLDKLVESNVAAGRLSFATDLRQPVADADAVFIAVGTPSRRGDGHADLTYVFDAACEVAAALDGYTVIVTKSTVPVGTGAEVFRVVSEARPDAEFDVASNPEFLREGAAISDFMRPDRVVVGAESDRARDVMRELYRSLFLNETPVMFTALQTAELIKYAANAFLATKITFINEIANLCELVDANVQDVARGIGLDGRIGAKFLHAGPGYGGSCFPKDVAALASTAEDHGYDFQIVKAVESVNREQKRVQFRQIVSVFGEDLSGKRFAVWGLAFKPNTDDMRETPAITLIDALLEAGASVVAHDPEAAEESKRHYLGDRIEYAKFPMDAVEGADALVLVTEWNEFRRPDFAVIKTALKEPIVFDGRNIWTRETLEELGFTYHGIGR